MRLSLLGYLHRSLELLSLTKDIFSLTELTDLTERYCAQFRTHRTPPAYRYHRALLPMKIPIRRQKQPTSSPHGYLGDHSPSLRGRGRGRGHHLLWALCVLFICEFCEKKNVPLWEKESFSVKVGMLNIQTEIVRIFRLLHPSPFEERLSWKREEALLHSRTCPSCVLKTPFLMQEGRLL